jgi:hypothetical protein
VVNIDEIIRRLFDGLDKNKNDWRLAKKILLEYQIANQLSIKELDDLCWEDSAWVFDQIYS